MTENASGERLGTSFFDENTVEHLHRYAFACELTKNKSVLDIACGEGYGSNLLALGAREVTGIDAAADVIDKAKRKYNKSNLKFIQGALEKIPIADCQFEVVVSFETLEHIEAHEVMLEEIKRVLVPGGLLLLSTPEKKYYSDLPGYKNPFHKKELYESQLRALIGGFFSHSQYLYQRFIQGSVMTSGIDAEIKFYTGNFDAIKTMPTINPMYLVVLASDREFVSAQSSVFDGNDLLETALSRKESEIHRTWSYRLGHSLLAPIKLLRRLVRNV
jgi:ubiquinone/menaquinone biosynthesis C-methylase UbiE